MARYGNDPPWITARYEGTCVKCSTKVPKGTRVCYYPNGRQVKCEPCGDAGQAEFDAQAWDDGNNSCL